MHHVILDQWSRRQSPLHNRDARVKLIAVLALLVIVATTPPLAWRAFAGYAAVLLMATYFARLPIQGILVRALAVLPFSAVFAVSSWLSGDTVRAAGLVEKALLSAWIALLLVSTTPLPALLKGAQSLGVPRLLILVIQFVYRYLFVLYEQAQRMRLASQCRSGERRARSAMFAAAAGALGVLFARSYQRANAIHCSMQARGFTGSFPASASGKPAWPDAAFLAGAVVAALAARIL
jgi:cobalt/nickel transport system permease protein